MEGGLFRAVAARLVWGCAVHSVRHVLRARALAFSRAQEMVDAKMGWRPREVRRNRKSSTLTVVCYLHRNAQYPTLFCHETSQRINCRKLEVGQPVVCHSNRVTEDMVKLYLSVIHQKHLILTKFGYASL